MLGACERQAQLCEDERARRRPSAPIVKLRHAVEARQPTPAAAPVEVVPRLERLLGRAEFRLGVSPSGGATCRALLGPMSGEFLLAIAAEWSCSHPQ